MSEVFQRCPRCGNENRLDSFACSFCGKRLRVERIENIRLFRRIESEAWTKPYPWYMKIIYLIIDPSRAFWDINHKRKTAPGYLILLFNSLLWGLMGLAFFSHFQMVTGDATAANYYNFFLISYNASIFLAFFFFGYLFQLIFFSILIWLFSRGANYAVGFSERLEARFGKEEEDEKYKQVELSPFSIYKGGTMLQKQESHKHKMLMCAFAPFLVANSIKVLIILVAFPTTELSLSSAQTNFSLFNSPVWAVLDIIDALTIGIWVPVLMAIGIRELGNSSTIRVLISSISIGIIVAIIFYFMRPTLFGAFI